MLHKAEKHLKANKRHYAKAFEANDSSYSNGGRTTECIADNSDCEGMDILSFVYNVELGCNSEKLVGFTYINDLWGWNDPRTGKEYALAGMYDGTSILDISNPTSPIVLGYIDTSGTLAPEDFSGFWRDIKIVNNVAYIGSEVFGHGVQVFDMNCLRKKKSKKGTKSSKSRSKFDEESSKLSSGKSSKSSKLSKAKGYRDLQEVGTTPSPLDVPRIEADLTLNMVGSSHNLVMFSEMDKLFVVGLSEDSTACDVTKGKSVAVFDVSNPLKPVFEYCLSGDYNVCKENDIACSYDGYIHDGQCFIYQGPDYEYTGVPICVFFCETEVVLFNMDTVKIISQFTWPDAAYIHQKWFSKDFCFLYGNDELDELLDTTGNGQFPRTRVVDMTDLDNPNPPLTFFDNTNAHPSIDHNLYVKGKYIYSANYEAGSRVYEIQDKHSLVKVAYYDISSECDNIENCFDPFGGSWTHFPYFDLGHTIG